MNDQWINTYLDLLYKGKHSAAMNCKCNNMCSTMYRYERFEECRIESIENSQVFLSSPESFNDVYDTKGIYYSEDFLKAIYSILPTAQCSFKEFMQFFEDIINKYYMHCGIVCFAEVLDNFPMWWSYADNRQGFCVEYDFSRIKGNNITNNIHPVLYLKEKFNFENILRPFFEQIQMDDLEITPANLIFHYLLGSIKHESWSYEKEWRYIVPFKQGLDGFPKIVTAIYLGDRFNPANYARMIELCKKVECDLYQMTIPKHTDKSFSFIPVKIEY